MSINLSLKKGLDLSLEGEITDFSVKDVEVGLCAVTPDDFTGFIPKIEVREGDKVMVGSPLLHDKNNESVKITSPLAGTVKSVVRGERRKIERVVIESDGSASSLEFDKSRATTSDGLLELLSESGMMSRIRQRPYDIVPSPAVKPRDIFVTAIDSAPLAADMTIALKGKERELAAAVKALSSLTSGKVYIGRRAGSLSDIPGAEMVDVSGRHPAGNAGVLIANIAPVNKGEVVWTLDAVTLAKIGTLLETGRVDASALVAVTGSEIQKPCMVRTTEGAAVGQLIGGNIKSDGVHHRIISGNVLTGIAVGEDGFLRFPYRQITVIPEGDDVDEFMGWASMSPSKMSVSRSFPGHFLKRRFAPDARLNGGRRAMIMSGQFDKVMPMDILPEYLLKAIIGRDIDKMEQLGIYEVAPEDFALAEYVDTSKMELQKIVREGLDYLRKETE